jgi:hypothetical protein
MPPPLRGFYGLSNARRWILIEWTADIKGALLAHLSEQTSELNALSPTGFTFELCDAAMQTSRQNDWLWSTSRLSIACTAGEFICEPRERRRPVMEFVLLGFDQSDSIRLFRFESIGPGPSPDPGRRCLTRHSLASTIYRSRIFPCFVGSFFFGRSRAPLPLDLSL